MYGYREARTKDGHIVLITSPRRTAHINRAWGYYNAVTVIWVDEQYRQTSRETVSLGKFNKAHHPVYTGVNRLFDAGTQTFV